MSRVIMIPPILTSGTRSWVPARLIILFSKMSARDERLVQVHRIIDNTGNDEPTIAVRLIGAIVVFRQHGLITIRYAVLPEIAGPHLRRDNLQAARQCWFSPSRPVDD